MTSVLLQPGALMVDGVGLTSLPDHSVVVDAGYQAESLYLVGRYATTRTAIERAWTAGVSVMLNYERLANAAKGGYRAGEVAAREAIPAARALGFNGECPLPFSAADEHFADLAGAGLDYHRALVDVFTPIGWVGGAYGFKEMLELLSRQDWWPDDWPLWHWGGDGKTEYPWAWVKQGPGGSYFDATINRQVDRNKLLKPMRAWSGDGPDPLEPTEDDMDDTDRQVAQDTLNYAAGCATQLGVNLGGTDGNTTGARIAEEVVKAIDGATVTIDYDLLAKKVVDEQARRLANG